MRSQLMADDFTAAIAVATRVGGDAPLPSRSAHAERVRAARAEANRRHPQRSAGRLAAGGTLTVDLADDVPPGPPRSRST